MTARARWLVLVFAVLLCIELPGSWLAEPDEARYAEIPREMLARGDWVTPYLNGAPYLEKPPLLYWMNAAAIAVGGDHPFVARIAVRLSMLATAAMLVVALEPVASGWGWCAALLLLSSPLGFVLGRFNLTDGVLSVTLTLTLLALRRVLLTPDEEYVPFVTLTVLGVGAGLAMLAKGLIAIAFPALIGIAWMAIMGRWRRLTTILASPAPVVFVAVAAPWFVLADRATPGFAQFFFIHEHFSRFATNEAHRTGPLYFFVLVFAAGVLPWTGILLQALHPFVTRSMARLRADPDGLFFALWMVIIIVFFSASRSKLIPYVLPALPPAAALAARTAVRGEARPAIALLPIAILVTVALFGGIAFGVAKGELARYDVTVFAVAGASCALVGIWLAVWRARTSRDWLTPSALGLAGFYLALVLALPRLSDDLSSHRLSVAATRVPGATVVSYKWFLQTLPLVQRSPVVVADYVGELGSLGARPDSLYWTADRFWNRWNSGSPLVAVLRRREEGAFRKAAHVSPRAVVANRTYLVVTNVPLDSAASAP